ncbi:hypothetical protein LZ31DRAFT_107071 [Colletotrichum somersetense]|nr:hypothetical protein LZ31DRAFT_107071 [Colletotrichum somersetense]
MCMRPNGRGMQVEGAQGTLAWLHAVCVPRQMMETADTVDGLRWRTGADDCMPRWQHMTGVRRKWPGIWKNPTTWKDEVIAQGGAELGVDKDSLAALHGVINGSNSLLSRAHCCLVCSLTAQMEANQGRAARLLRDGRGVGCRLLLSLVCCGLGGAVSVASVHETWCKGHTVYPSTNECP